MGDLSDSGARREQELVAGLFDRFLDDVLDGAEANLEPLIAEYPHLKDDIEQAWRLARETAGRNEQTRPVVAGYRLLHELGRGGMGVVYLAEHESLGRRVALKVLPSTATLSTNAKRRFLSEARALARVDSEHVVRIYNIIERDDLLAFEMEWVDGTSFRDLLSRLGEGPRDPSLTDLRTLLGAEPGSLGERSLLLYYVRIGISIARALESVHAVDLIHRDVKPSNILVRRDGSALLADFGLVRGTDASVSVTGGFVGTLRYAAPEQLREDQDAIQPSSDVYSLAVTLWEAIAGRPPFDGNSSVALLRRIESGDVPRLRKVAPQVPRDLETVLSKAMDPSPGNRYSSAGEFADDLERILKLQPIQARPLGAPRRFVRWSRRHRRSFAAAALGLIAGVFLLVPVVVDARSRDVREDRVRDHVAAARTHLLTPMTRQRAWSQSVIGAVPEAIRMWGTPLDLDAALADYDAALRMDPDDETLRIERSVVAIARVAERRVSGETMDVDPSLDQLPPLTRSAAEALLGSSLRPEFDPAAAIEADPDDRLALGLLSFLVGDASLCEAAWAELDPLIADGALVDAGLGVIYRADGRSDRAFACLSRAAEAFPGQPFVTAELAASALDLGYERLVAQWLDSMPDDLGDDAEFVSCVRAGLAVMQGDRDVARQTFESLADRSDLIGVHARMSLGELDRAAGQLEAAAARYAELVRRHPGAARFRLAAARAALERGDAGSYLDQALWVLKSGYGVGRSTGTVNDMLEILEIGGLKTMHTEGVEATGHDLDDDEAEYWPRASVLGSPFESPAEVEDLLRRRLCFDQMRERHWRPDWSPAIRAALAAVSIGARALVCAPELMQGTSAGTRLVARTSVELLDEHWSEFVIEFVPGVLGLPDPSGLTAHLERRFVGEAAGDSVGDVIAVEDVDSDGVHDILVGRAMSANDGGRFVRMFSGRSGRQLWRREADEESSMFGSPLVPVGDIDGDGVADVGVGDSTASDVYREAGALVLLSGVDGRVIGRLSGGREFAAFGASAKTIGDVDGDGFEDLVVGAPSLPVRFGSATVFSGVNQEPIHELVGPPTSLFGCAVEALGDVDGDGVPDFAIGAMLANLLHGRVWVYSGRDGSVIRELHGDSGARLFGASLAAADFDGDGEVELAVSAPLALIDGRSRGAVYVFDVGDWVAVARLDGEDAGATFGERLAVADFDADGVEDLAISASGSRRNGERSGAVMIYRGPSLRTVPESIRSYFGRMPGHRLGVDLAAFPDVDGDRCAELLVGAGGAEDAAGEVLLLLSGQVR